MAEFETLTAPAMDTELTAAQNPPEVSIDISTQTATKKAPKTSWFAVVREVRKHPTVKLARLLSVAPAMVAGWAVEADDNAPQGAKELIEDTFLRMRSQLLNTALLNMVDFGYSPFEKVWHLDPKTGATVIKKFKPLLVDITKIRVDPENGSYAGLYQTFKDARGNEKKLPIETIHTLTVAQNVEGTNWYGQGDIEDIEPHYQDWKTTASDVRNYQKKFSGAHWVVTYPVGTSLINGTVTQNSEIARNLLTSLRSNGGVTIPRTLRGPNGQGDLTANKIITDQDWAIELIEPRADGMTSFDNRFRYLDTLLIRGMVQPERALTEGKNGTKAEAEAHGEAGMVYSFNRLDMFMQSINLHAVRQVMELNYGPEVRDTVRLITEPVGAEDKLFMRDIYKAILGNQQGYTVESASIDSDAIKRMLKIPALDEDDRVAMLREQLGDPTDPAPTDPAPTDPPQNEQV